LTQPNKETTAMSNDTSSKPLGTGAGAPGNASANKGRDVTARPSDKDAVDPGHDFNRDPAGKPLSPKPRDMTQGQAPPQKNGPPPDLNEKSVSPEGRWTKRDPPPTRPATVGQPSAPNRVPFKNMK